MPVSPSDFYGEYLKALMEMVEAAGGFEQIFRCAVSGAATLMAFLSWRVARSVGATCALAPFRAAGACWRLMRPKHSEVFARACEMLEDPDAEWDEPHLICEGIAVEVASQGAGDNKKKGVQPQQHRSVRFGIAAIRTGKQFQWDVMDDLTDAEMDKFVDHVNRAIARVKARDRAMRADRTLKEMAAVSAPKPLPSQVLTAVADNKS